MMLILAVAVCFLTNPKQAGGSNYNENRQGRAVLEEEVPEDRAEIERDLMGRALYELESFWRMKGN